MHSASSDLDAVPGSIAAARALVRSRCRDAGMPEAACEVAVLLTSELVTNALVHAASPARLSVTATDAFVHVEVGDESAVMPEVVHARRDAVHGRGMALVDRLAGEWGTRLSAGGKVVWFTIDKVCRL